LKQNLKFSAYRLIGLRGFCWYFQRFSRVGSCRHRFCAVVNAMVPSLISCLCVRADRRSINRSINRSKSSLLQLDAIHVGTVEVVVRWVVSGESIVCPKSETKLDGQKEIEIRTTTFLRAITIFITLTQVQCNAIQFIRILSTSIQINPIQSKILIRIFHANFVVLVVQYNPRIQ
jgi:hypothetical protein